jgi:glycosyltransferase involved in cell wall biosynthesis
MGSRTYIFCSNRALYRPWLRAAEILVQIHGLEGHVIAPEEYADSPVWESSGKLRRKDFDTSSTSLKIHFLPARNGDVERFGFETNCLREALQSIKPAFIYVQAEFWEGIAHQFLWHYRFCRTPQVVAYAATNHLKAAAPLFSMKQPFFSRTRLFQKLLWPRLDGICACATASKECARRIGLPQSVPVKVNYLPVFGPEQAAAEGIILPWKDDGAFTIGFAGALTEQKGWKILLAALERLPNKFRLVIAGDGKQRGHLKAMLQQSSLNGRASYAGLLSHERLLATYPLFDVFVLPSITTAYSVEQFGAALAEAMASGVPVIGSNSGAIPEVIGEAGLIFPESDDQALARAILRMSEDEELRHRCVAWGRERYRNCYSCEAYARSLAALLKISESAT